MSELIMDLDAPITAHAQAGNTHLALTASAIDLFRFLPFFAKIIDGIKTAIQSGKFTLPALTIKVFGRHLTFGPVPIALLP